VRTLGIPATKIAEEQGNNRAANTAMLGFWSAVEGVLDKEALEQAIKESVPPKTVELNLNVFQEGYQRGLDADQRQDAE
jgi:2-oxoglutarate ferredoxin oxidoreductase subunit gamma